LLELIKRLRATLNNIISQKKIESYELIFINDNSSDRSEELIKSEIPYGNITLLNMSRNFGTSECVLAGFQESDGDAVIYMDSDLQDPPELIEKMIDAWSNDIDVEVVYTTRLKRNQENWFKLLLIKIGYRVINKISDIPLAVDSGDFKLLSRRVVNEILKLNEFNPYLRGLVSWVGFKQVQIFYERDGRFDGAHNTKVKVLSKKNISYWLDRALISFSDAPLKVMLFIGMLTISISIIMIIYAIVHKLSGDSVPGWAAIVVVISFMSGMQFFILGILGLYIGAIFRQSKNRPHFIIKNKIKS
jgi:dolichol-phosphate mannosyltransferase